MSDDTERRVAYLAESLGQSPEWVRENLILFALRTGSAPTREWFIDHLGRLAWRKKSDSGMTGDCRMRN